MGKVNNNKVKSRRRIDQSSDISLLYDIATTFVPNYCINLQISVEYMTLWLHHCKELFQCGLFYSVSDKLSHSQPCVTNMTIFS